MRLVLRPGVPTWVVTARPDTFRDLGAIRSWAQIVPLSGTNRAQKCGWDGVVGIGTTVVVLA